MLNKSVLSTLALLTFAACDTDKEPDSSRPIETISDSNMLRKFQSCDQLRDYVGDVTLNTILSHRYGYWGWGYDYAAESDTADSGSGDSSSGPSDYTTTNVQEEGVDEIDMVKTDGQFIYVAQDRTVQIVDSWPVEDASLVATVELSGWARGLFLQGDKLVVFETISNEHSDVVDSWNGSRVTVINIADRSAPVIERQIDIDGYLADGRMVDGEVYLVLNHWLQLPYELWDIVYDNDIELPQVNWDLSGDDLERNMAQARQQARQILRPYVDTMIAEMELEEILPSWRNQEMGDADAEITLMHDCSDIYRPQEISQYNMLSLVHVDVESNVLNSTGLMANGWTIYASQENLYVAQSSRWWWWGWGDMSMDTHIHKFELNGGAEPSYSGSGAVGGWIYDQFAMSEYEGALRVATTDFDWWGWSSEEEGGNNIYVLQENIRGSLSVSGHIGGIAPGERIYAARMMGEKGYLVTFRQVDPLYTLDLSDPNNPQVIGELKIPGYSAYLHPFGEDHLLAVGMDGDDDGNLSGLAINVFDVSDFDNPTLAHQYTIESDGWAWSESLWDHHAFTFHRGVLSIPAMSYNYEEGEYFSGMMAFEIDAEAGIEKLGQINHRDLVERSECLYSSLYGYEASVCDDWAWYASIRRSVYIEDNLFSISNYGMKVNDLMNPEEQIAEVLFFPEE